MFKQHATGSFSVEVGGDWHCGPDHTSPKLLTYDIVIEYHGADLDKHGFLIDNTEFKKYFDSIHYTESSCELMCKAAADHFCEIANHRLHTGGLARVDVDICVPGLADVCYEEVEETATSKRIRGLVG